jgi:hypothetical protein
VHAFYVFHINVWGLNKVSGRLWALGGEETLSTYKLLKLYFIIYIKLRHIIEKPYSKGELIKSYNKLG